MALYGLFKYCLSGTPFVNESTDLWSQLRFLGFNGAKKAADWRKKGKSMISEYDLHSTILTQKVDKKTLPPLDRIIHNVTMSPLERAIYDATLTITRKMLTLVKTGTCFFFFSLFLFLFFFFFLIL